MTRDRNLVGRWHLSLNSDYRPAVLPCHGRHNGSPAHRPVILKYKAIPVAVLIVDDTALCDTIISEAHIISDYHFPFPLAVERFASVTKLRSFAIGGPCYDKNIVISVQLIDVRTLGKAALDKSRVVDEFSLGSGLDRTQILFQFNAPYLSAAVDKIHLAVVVEQKTHIMEALVIHEPVPFSVFYIVGMIDISFSGREGSEAGVIHTVVISEGSRPLTLAVIVLPVS